MTQVMEEEMAGRGWVAGRRGRGAAPAASADDAAPNASALLRDAFSSPARLSATLRELVIEPESLFYSPGSLLRNDFDPSHPVGFGMPASWPVFFESDHAYRLTPSFDIRPEGIARYPADGEILQSGWLLGEDLLRDQANVVAFKVGRGYVVTLGTQVHFRRAESRHLQAPLQRHAPRSVGRRHPRGAREARRGADLAGGRFAVASMRRFAMVL
jgi:hypothetical protein